MYLKNITLKNFKCIEEVEIDLKMGFNLILGNNGTGKSTILEGISIGISSFFEKITDVSCRGIASNDVRADIVLSGDATTNTEYHAPTQIISEILLGDTVFSVLRERKDESSTSRTTSQPKKLAITAQSLLNDTNSQLPLLSFQSTSRVWQQKRSDFASDLKTLSNGIERKRGYVGCLDSAIDTKGIVNWVLAMDYAEYQKKSTIREYRAFQEIVTNFMKEMEELPDSPKLQYSTALSELVYETTSGTYKISQLSAGYQSVLWMVMDLAYRAVTLNPHIDLDKTPISGIVLIDEIDVHLHPKWQWKIVNALTKSFPSVQFIAATHSPIVISSCKNANIISIDEDHKIHELNKAYGVSVNDVLDLRLGSMDMPEIVKKLLSDIEEAINDFDKEIIERKINELSEELGSDHPQVRLAKDNLELDLLIEEL